MQGYSPRPENHSNIYCHLIIGCVDEIAGVSTFLYQKCRFPVSSNVADPDDQTPSTYTSPIIGTPATNIFFLQTAVKISE